MNWTLQDSYSDINPTFIHPFSLIIAGSSQSGKTYLTMKMIKSIDKIMFPPPEEIIILYLEHQELYEEIKLLDKRVKLIRGLNFEISPIHRSLIIIDDQMGNALDDKNIRELFLSGVHHKSISVIFITQN